MRAQEMGIDQPSLHVLFDIDCVRVQRSSTIERVSYCRDLVKVPPATDIRSSSMFQARRLCAAPSTTNFAKTSIVNCGNTCLLLRTTLYTQQQTRRRTRSSDLLPVHHWRKHHITGGIIVSSKFQQHMIKVSRDEHDVGRSRDG